MQAFAYFVVMAKLPPNQYYFWRLSTERKTIERVFVANILACPDGRLAMLSMLLLRVEQLSQWQGNALRRTLSGLSSYEPVCPTAVFRIELTRVAN